MGCFLLVFLGGVWSSIPYQSISTSLDGISLSLILFYLGLLLPLCTRCLLPCQIEIKVEMVLQMGGRRGSGKGRSHCSLPTYLPTSLASFSLQNFIQNHYLHWHRVVESPSFLFCLFHNLSRYSFNFSALLLRIAGKKR